MNDMVVKTFVCNGNVNNDLHVHTTTTFKCFHITLVKVAKFCGHSLNSTEVIKFPAKGKGVAQKTPSRSE